MIFFAHSGIFIIVISFVIVMLTTSSNAFQHQPTKGKSAAFFNHRNFRLWRYDSRTLNPRKDEILMATVINAIRYTNHGAEKNANASPEPRRTFFQNAISIYILAAMPKAAVAFEGGVGGLGKTKPQTGIEYANTDLSTTVTSGSRNMLFGGNADFNAELLTPDGKSAVFLSFFAPWPMMRSSGIESRDLSNPEAAFVQVAPLDLIGKGGSDAILNKVDGTIDLPTSFFIRSIFAPSGKFGAYGAPTDVRVKKNIERGKNISSSTTIYTATFTTLTPSMIESNRKVLIAVSVVGDGVFMLVAGTTAARFKKQTGLIEKAVESFSCVEAPKTDLRR